MWSVIAAAAFAQTVQTGFSAQNYRPSIDARTSLWAERTATLPDWTGTAQILGVYTGNPLVFLNRPRANDDEVWVSDLAQADVTAALHYGRFRLGALVPVYLATDGSAIGAPSAGLGDLALDLKGNVLRDGDAPLGLAVSGRLIVPSATVEGPVGVRNTGWEVSALADKEIDRVALVGNLGLRGAPETALDDITLDDQLLYRVGAAYLAEEDGTVGVSFDVAGQVNLRQAADGGAPVEGMLGGWGYVADELVLRGGVGTGFTDSIGDPDLRVVVGVAYDPARKRRLEPQAAKIPADRDADGILDDDDDCPRDAEIRDGILDDDGCPEEGTRVELAVQSPGGKPITNAVLSLKAGETTWTGTGELLAVVDPGTYVLDAKALGYADLHTEVVVPEGDHQELVRVMQPNDVPFTVRLRDYSGRPLDGEWSVDGGPWVAAPGGEATGQIRVGAHTFAARAKGRPAVELKYDVSGEFENTATLELGSKVTYTNGDFAFAETVTFDTAKSGLGSSDYALLDEVAAILVHHKDIARIRIEGHTDSQGGDASNLELSNRRAAAVASYLKARGVASSRIDAVGYGEAKPVASNDTADGRAQNRRVSISIAERAAAVTTTN